MRIEVSRFPALVLMILLYPIVLLVRLCRFVAGYRKPVYKNTIEGDPLDYAGEKPMLIVIWAEWASVWTAATANVVEQLRNEFSDRCEFAYIEASSKSATSTLDAKTVPVLILRHRGVEIDRFVNTMDVDEVRPAIAAIVG